MTLRFALGYGWCLAIRVSTPPQQDLPLVVYYKYWEKHRLFLRLFLQDNAGAVNIYLTSSDLLAIEALLARFPNISPRYAENLAKLVGK
jgi:hypothetical protein